MCMCKTAKQFDDVTAQASGKQNWAIKQDPTENLLQQITRVNQVRKEFEVIPWKQSITCGQLQGECKQEMLELSKQGILEETNPFKNPINCVQKTY